MRVLANSPEETEATGRQLASTLGPGSVVCLYGGLGAGKTVFVKGIASALGIDPADIISASFTIIAEYDSSPPLYHADLYRLAKGADLEDLGLYDYMDGQGITVIEWADRLPDIEAEGAIKVNINLVTEGSREIIIDVNE
ncbi:tRNA (adenosine(37)-N6)-threonylcarbamoyltransferase complex ATPase subunit type 1 TsaE [Nitrospirota bacterium]